MIRIVTVHSATNPRDGGGCRCPGGSGGLSGVAIGSLSICIPEEFIVSFGTWRMLWESGCPGTAEAPFY